MKQAFLIIAVLFCFVASAQYTPTGSKTRFVNGIGLGTKSDAAFGTVDSLVLYATADSSLKFKYKGTARALAYATSLSSYKLISDTLFNNGYTTRNTTKKVIDSLSATLTSAIAAKLSLSDTLTMLSPYQRAYNAVTITGTQTITGAKTFSAALSVGSTLGVGGDAQFNQNISLLGSISVGTVNYITGSQIYNYKNGEAGLRLHGNTTTDNSPFGTINFGNTNDISGGYLTARIKAVKQTYDNGADLVFETATAASTPTERMRIGFTGLITVAGLGTGTLYTNSGVLTNTNPSDSTIKNTIKPIGYGLAEILKLQPKTFYYNSDSAKISLKYGFIAQEVKPIMPDVVRKLEPKDPKSKLGLETDGIYVTLVKAIQEQQAIIDDLKKRIVALENK